MHGCEQLAQTSPTLNSRPASSVPISHSALDRSSAVIAEILGSIDDLIENNRRRIALLEQMAQAIYREWFVHFRYPGHEDDELVDSPLGPIPSGWAVADAAGSRATVVDGAALDERHEYWTTGLFLQLHGQCELRRRSS